MPASGLLVQALNAQLPACFQFAQCAHVHGRVAFLPWTPISLKCLKPKEPALEPRTLGDHLRRRRLELKHSQEQAARLLGVTSWTISNWEKGRSTPPIQSLSRLFGFLGYDPFPESTSLPERLLAKRRAMGWSIAKAADSLGVDRGAWSDWERGGVILFRTHRTLVAKLLGAPVENLDQEMRERWNRSHKGTRFRE